MDFNENKNYILKIEEKLNKEKKQFYENLLKEDKEKIILFYLEQYIYSRLLFFFHYLQEKIILENQDILETKDLKNIMELENIMEYVKLNYFKGATFQDRLSNANLISYFKGI